GKDEARDSPRRMTGPAEPAGRDGNRSPVVEPRRDQAEVLDVELLVAGEEVVPGDGVNSLEPLPGEPACERDRVDADVVQLALGSCELVVARRELLLATPSERGGPGAPLPEEEVGVDTGQAAQPPGRHEVARRGRPRLRDHAEHVAAHTGGSDGLHQGIGLAERRYERLVEVEMLARGRTAQRDPPAPLRRRACAA